jgi:hypothetical protein
MRSKISTFASTDMPMVRIRPATPGSVKVARSLARIAISITRFSTMAAHASVPDQR